MLTGIVIAKNEEKHIQNSLKTLSFCDEVLLINNDSIDSTADYARGLGVSVITESKVGDFSYLRNVAAKKAKGEWLLYLDADEEISPDLRANIKHELEKPSADAYYLRRRDHFMGQTLEHGEVATVYERGIIRLMRKETGTWSGKIHEEWLPEGIVSSLDGFIEHYPHQNIHDFLEHINMYSQIRAEELYHQGKRTNAFEIVAYPLGKFLYTYILKGGIKDGFAGCIYSGMMSFHSFLVRSTLFLRQFSHE